MKIHSMCMVSALAVLSLFAAACGDRRPDEPVIDGPGIDEPVASTLFDEVYTHLERGDSEEALVLLRHAMTELPDGIEKLNAFAMQIDILLREGRLTEAQEAYLDALATEPQCAEHAHGMIEQHLEFEDDESSLLVWAGRVLQAGPPPGLQPVYMRIELLALQRIGAIDDVVEALDRYSADTDPAMLGSLTLSIAEKLIEDEQISDAERLHQWLTTAGDRDEAYLRPIALLEMDLLIARDLWERFNDAAQRALDLLEDREAATRFERWRREAMRARRVDVADRLAEQTLTRHERLPVTAVRAARWHIAIPWQQGDGDKALTRFEDVTVGGGLPARHLSPLIGWMADAIFNDGTRDQALRFLEISDAIPWSDMADDARNRHVGILLDISFNAADYERSIALLDEGLPHYDDRWHEVMRNKVYAHKAEDTGNTDEAVRRFRLFMEHIVADKNEEDDADLIDPVSGHRVTNSMILALNARRIGNILSLADRVEEASDAYAEAADYYRQAIDEVGENSPEADWIREQLADMASPNP